MYKQFSIIHSVPFWIFIFNDCFSINVSIFLVLFGSSFLYDWVSLYLGWLFDRLYLFGCLFLSCVYVFLVSYRHLLIAHPKIGVWKSRNPRTHASKTTYIHHLSLFLFFLLLIYLLFRTVDTHASKVIALMSVQCVAYGCTVLTPVEQFVNFQFDANDEISTTNECGLFSSISCTCIYLIFCLHFWITWRSEWIILLYSIRDSLI